MDFFFLHTYPGQSWISIQTFALGSAFCAYVDYRVILLQLLFSSVY